MQMSRRDGLGHSHVARCGKTRMESLMFGYGVYNANRARTPVYSLVLLHVFTKSENNSNKRYRHTSIRTKVADARHQG
jgi:hypothetical protein